MYFHGHKTVSKRAQNEKVAQCQKETGRLSCFMKGWRIPDRPHLWRSTLTSPGHFQGPTTFPSSPSPCCSELKVGPFLFPSLPSHFVLSRTMEKESDLHLIDMQPNILQTLKQIFKRGRRAECLLVPDKILPLADVFLGRMFCMVRGFFSYFQASSRWLTSLISSGNFPAPALPSWTTP